SSTPSSTHASDWRHDAMATMQAESLSVPRRPTLLSWLKRENFPWIPTLILLSIALLAIFAGYIAPHDPEIGSIGRRFRPPAWQSGGSFEYLLGTDHLGRDILSRLIFGARVSTLVGFTSVIIAGAIGTTLGIISGYLGGWVDQVIMRITDTW